MPSLWSHSQTPGPNLKIMESLSLNTVLVVDSFINNQDVRQSSRDQYRRNLGVSFSWLDREGLQLGQVQREDILNFKNSLLDRGISTLTVNGYLSTTRKFYEWTESVKIYPNVAKSVKNARQKRQFKKQPLTIEQAKELLASFKGHPRNFAFLNLLLRTGLRTIEVVRANCGDIKFKQGRRVLMVQGKGRDEKDNFVVLTDKAFEPIKRYLKTRGNPKNGIPLFISTSPRNRGQRLKTQTISKTVKAGLRGIGLDSEEYTAHSLRHTCAVNLLRASGTLADVQDVLRHSSPATSQIYTQSIKEELRLANPAESLLDEII